VKKLRVLDNEEGYVKLIFVTAVIVFCVYAGAKFGIPYYKYSAFKSDVKEIARISIGDINKTRTEIFQRAQELKVPVEEKDIVIDKREHTVRVRTSWSETVDLLGVYQKTLDFDIDEEE